MDENITYKALVVEDDVELAETVCQALRQCGFYARQIHDHENAIAECLREESFHLVVVDHILPGANGLTLLEKLKDACPATYCVLLTGYGTADLVSIAYKRGVIEYIPKPVRMRDLRRVAERVKRDVPLFLPNRFLGEPREWQEFEGLLTREPVMLAVIDTVRAAAEQSHPVLLIGEGGVGKTSIARAIHRRSTLAGGPFILLRTAAYPVKRLGGALFGRERGAAAVERAEGGTLYIDDITVLDSQTQAQLLELIETGRYKRFGKSDERKANVRLVISSPRELEPLVQSGAVNQALYRRLFGCLLRVPPLRERQKDIALIANRILQRLIERGQCKVQRFAAATEKVLSSYSWPGNVRELESTIHLAVFGVRSTALMPYQLPAVISSSTPVPGQLSIPLGTKLVDVEREVILQTLRMSDGNKSQAADALGISRRSLYDKLLHYQQLYGIDLLESKDKGSSQDPA